MPGYPRSCALMLCLLLGACRDGEDAPAQAPAASEARIAEAIAAPPWLRDRLPDDAIAYLRVPSPWAFLAAPTGRANARAFSNASHVEAIASMRSATDAELTSLQANAALQLLNRVGAPIEVAVLARGRVASPAARLLLATTLDYDDAQAALAAFAAALAASVPGADPSMLPPPDAEGFAQASFGDAGLAVRFRAADRRLIVLAGAGVDGAALRAVIGDLDTGRTEAHRMQALEGEIDAVGQGLVAWVDVRSLMPLLAAGLAAPEQRFARRLLSQTEAVATGFGTVNGSGRMSYRVSAPGAEWLDWLPRTRKRMDIAAVGTPRWMFAMALPSAEDYARIRTALGRDAGADALAGLERIETLFANHVGASIADILQALGPSLVAFGDEAGQFSALQLRDRTVVERLIERASALPGASHTTHDLGGRTIHHLILPDWRMALTKAQGPLGRIGSHLFWVDEDDWLVFATVPQPLRDRIRGRAGPMLGDWYRDVQGADASQALLAGAVRLGDTQRDAYYGYLAVLNLLGDLSGRPFDPFAFPSADEIDLPRESSLGLLVGADEGGVAIQIGYGATPIEALYGGHSMATVTMLGILAAIAVPAYQDYTIRAHVAQRLAAAQPWKVHIAEAYLASGRAPGYQAFPPATGFPVELAEGIRYLEDGSIEIDVDRTATRDGGVLRLHPSLREGTLHWRCEGTLEPRFLPVACR